MEPCPALNINLSLLGQSGSLASNLRNFLNQLIENVKYVIVKKQNYYVKKFPGITINMGFYQFTAAQTVVLFFKIQDLVNNFILIIIKKHIET